MKNSTRNAMIRWLLPALLLAGTAVARTRPSAPVAPATAAPAAPAADALTAALQQTLSGAEHEFVATAAAMPSSRFQFAPSPSSGEFQGVRTWAQQVKHVAAVNFEIFSVLLGQPMRLPGPGENGPASVRSKEQIMKYLRDSFAYGHRALVTINQKNALQVIHGPFGPMTRLQLATMVPIHMNDHYGQMVEYLRMNHIIPPASRPRPSRSGH